MEEKICGLTKEKHCGSREEAGGCGLASFSEWAECQFAFNAVVLMQRGDIKHNHPTGEQIGGEYGTTKNNYERP